MVLITEDISLCGMSTGVEAVEYQKEVVVYPSPAGGSDRIEIKGILGKAQVEIFDLTGALIFQNSVTAQNSSVNLPNLTPALYLIQVHTENSTFTTKLVVR